jgi:sulfhydrogenase subunit beta (sulfur reductase)
VQVDGPVFLPRDGLQGLIEGLQQAGYRCVGPRMRDEVIVYDTLGSMDDLPRGVHDRQSPGVYRTEHTLNARLFAWANGPQAIKPLLFKPRQKLWRAEHRGDTGIAFAGLAEEEPPLAVIGARSCDLAALRVQDRIFLGDQFVDPHYAARREGMFVVAVNCTHPSDCCFCASTGDGPAASHSYDLALTEVEAGFVCTLGTEAGRVMLERLDIRPAAEDEVSEAAAQVEQAGRAQQRGLPSGDLPGMLLERLEHPRWDDVAARCLSCANCTMVCPTCFCHAEHDEPALDGQSTLHLRQWDSCFSVQHATIHGFNPRAETKLRYRQWLTHKLSTWHEQFGSSGCVGCGRCISWCPVGIDLTEEVGAMCGEGGDA